MQSRFLFQLGLISVVSFLIFTGEIAAAKPHFCRSFLDRLFGSKVTETREINDYQWLNAIPKQDVFDQLLWGHSEAIPKNAKVLITTPDYLVESNRGTFQGQLLTLNGPYEEWILRQSKLRGNVEVAHARIFDNKGNLIKNSKILGVGGSKSIYSWELGKSVDGLETGRQTPYLVELTHVHPYFEYVATWDAAGKRNVTTATSPLAPDDFETIEADFLDVAQYVRLRAVLPNGYSYQATYHGSKRVADPLIHETVVEQVKREKGIKQVNQGPPATGKNEQNDLAKMSPDQIQELKNWNPWDDINQPNGRRPISIHEQVANKLAGWSASEIKLAKEFLNAPSEEFIGEWGHGTNSAEPDAIDRYKVIAEKLSAFDQAELVALKELLNIQFDIFEPKNIK